MSYSTTWITIVKTSPALSCVRHYSKHIMSINSFHLTTILWGKYYYHFYITDQETEQRGWVTCPRSTQITWHQSLSSSSFTFKKANLSSRTKKDTTMFIKGQKLKQPQAKTHRWFQLSVTERPLGQTNWEVLQIKGSRNFPSRSHHASRWRHFTPASQDNASQKREKSEKSEQTLVFHNSKTVVIKLIK